MKYCVFQIYGPLVSWGDIAIGIERRTFSHPTKSAIVGLIAAALGIRREEEARNQLLADVLGFGVKLISPGVIIRDFHTAQVPGNDKKVHFFTRKDEMTLNPDKIGTVLSKREYCSDALAIIAVWITNEKDGFTLEQIKSSIESPRYHLYFGRKSCPPGLPLRPELIEAETLKVAFDSYPVFPIIGLSFSENKSEKRKKYFDDVEKRIFYKNKPLYFWGEDAQAGINYMQKTIRYDGLLSRRRWQFAPRDEYMGVSEMEEKDVYQ